MAASCSSVLFLFLLLIFTSSLLASPASPPSPRLFFSPSFFHSNYQHMLQQFKLYIYPLQDTHSAFDFRSPHLQSIVQPQTVDRLFFHTLSHTRFVTDTADEADLFILPISVRAMVQTRTVSVTRNLMMYVQRLRDQYPYWQRTLGADHVLVSCQGIKRDFSRNVLELQKNAIWVACGNMLTAGSNGEFYPHKDLAISSYIPPASDLSTSAIASDGRPHLVLCLNSRDSIQPEFTGYDFLTEHTAFVSDLENADFSSYQNMLSSSKFCVLFNHMEAGISIVDAMRLGCVPVIISNGYLFALPFQDILDWQQFSLIVGLAQLSNLKSFLTNMPEGKYRALQDAAMVASKHFEWHSPPEPYDAFYMLMYELWLRRHTVRYAQRSA